MPLILDWKQIGIRLTLTVAAGMIIGFNRGERGRPAGVRTTMLVCLAASIAMIQANLLLNMPGRTTGSFATADVLRLPLGILSGMGFIGAGAILRRGNLVLGITTAATLWFTTVMGLCFGAGQLGLGACALVLGFGTLWGLKKVEDRLSVDQRATFRVCLSGDQPDEQALRNQITGGGCKILTMAVEYIHRGVRWRDYRFSLEHRLRRDNSVPPNFVSQLAADPRAEIVSWLPQGIIDSDGIQSEPVGTPVPISPAN